MLADDIGLPLVEGTRNVDLNEYCRTEVRVLALLMEAKLRQNEDKGGRKGTFFPQQFLKRLMDEVEELDASVDDIRGKGPSDARTKAVWLEAADVANFAMMSADAATEDNPLDSESVFENPEGHYRNIPRFDCQANRCELQTDDDPRCPSHSSGLHCGHMDTHDVCCDCMAEAPKED